MQKTNQIYITLIASVVSSRLGCLVVPVFLLIICNLIDYITGLCAAKYRAYGGISSYKSIKGICKKVCMWLLVAVGAVIDVMILYALSYVGKECNFSFMIACIVSIWLICNEIISILENMKDIGAPIPVFLLPIVNRIKSSAEKAGNELLESIGTEESEEKEI